MKKPLTKTARHQQLQQVFLEFEAQHYPHIIARQTRLIVKLRKEIWCLQKKLNQSS